MLTLAGIGLIYYTILGLLTSSGTKHVAVHWLFIVVLEDEH